MGVVPSERNISIYLPIIGKHLSNNVPSYRCKIECLVAKSSPNHTVNKSQNQDLVLDLPETKKSYDIAFSLESLILHVWLVWLSLSRNPGLYVKLQHRMMLNRSKASLKVLISISFQWFIQFNLRQRIVVQFQRCATI